MQTTFVALIQANHSNYPEVLGQFLERSSFGDELILTDCSANRGSNQKLRGYQLGPHNIRPVLLFEPVSEDVALEAALRARQFERVQILRGPIEKAERQPEIGGATGTRPKVKGVDLLFLPHNRYHTATSSVLIKRLSAIGVSAGVLHVTHHIKEEGVAEEADKLGVSLYRLEDIIDGRIAPRAIVVFNDWELVSRTILASAQAHGLMTISIVEGIQDYDDVDTGRERYAYRMCEKVVLPGPFDRRYFTDKQETVFGGIPRLHGLAERTLKGPPTQRYAAINVNFTYDVLEHKRNDWLTQAIKGCDEAGFIPRITRHPADMGEEFRELDSDQTAYDLIEDSSVLITRFSTLVLEALVLNRPVIYYNPHGEKVDKFLDSMGAYQIATSKNELKIALNRINETPLPPKREKAAFLKEHAHTGISNHNTVPSILSDFVNAGKSHEPDFEGFRRTLRSIDISTRCFSNKFPLLRIPARFGL